MAVAPRAEASKAQVVVVVVNLGLASTSVEVAQGPEKVAMVALTAAVQAVSVIQCSSEIAATNSQQQEQ